MYLCIYVYLCTYGNEPRYNDDNLVDRAEIYSQCNDIIRTHFPKSAELLNVSHRIISNFFLIQRLSTMTHKNAISF